MHKAVPSKKDLAIFMKRWKVVEEIEAAELRRLSDEDSLRMADSALRMGISLGLVRSRDRDLLIAKVRSRWLALRGLMK